jgi:hypothetical protein
MLWTVTNRTPSICWFKQMEIYSSYTVRNKEAYSAGLVQVPSDGPKLLLSSYGFCSTSHLLTSRYNYIVTHILGGEQRKLWAKIDGKCILIEPVLCLWVK